MRRIRKKDYDSWESYYWNYQQILAEDYYIPYLLNKGKVSQLNTKSIIDIGCGNGGFINAISTELKNSSDCLSLGIDIKSFKTWKDKSTPFKVHNILKDSNKDYKNKFDLVILRDVIEHIPNQFKQKFIQTARDFMSTDGKMLITFPPYLSPFGLHQQAIMKSFLKKVPYLSILPKSTLEKLITKFESKDTWIEAEEIIDSAMTINGFKKLINEAKLSVFNQRFFTIRPSHEIRYNVKSFQSPLGNVPLIREFFILGTCYLLKKDRKI